MTKIDVKGVDQFNELVASTDKLILIDFWAEWCGPCRMLGPVLEEVATEMEDQVMVLKINVDEDGNEGLATQFNVRSIPQVTFFKNWAQVDQFIGALPKPQVVAYVNKHVGAAGAGMQQQ